MVKLVAHIKVRSWSRSLICLMGPTTFWAFFIEKMWQFICTQCLNANLLFLWDCKLYFFYPSVKPLTFKWIASHQNSSVISRNREWTCSNSINAVFLNGQNKSCFSQHPGLFQPLHRASSYSCCEIHACSRQRSPKSRPRVTAACERECGLVLWKVNIAGATQKRWQPQLLFM